MRDRFNQFNLKYKDRKAPMSGDRMNTPPQNSTIHKKKSCNYIYREESDTESSTSSENNDEDNIEE